MNNPSDDPDDDPDRFYNACLLAQNAFTAVAIAVIVAAVVCAAVAVVKHLAGP